MVRSTGVGEVCVCQDVSGDRRVEVAVQILMKVYWAWQDLGPLMGKIRKFSLVSLNLGEISIRSLYSYTQRWGGGGGVSNTHVSSLEPRSHGDVWRHRVVV